MAGVFMERTYQVFYCEQKTQQKKTFQIKQGCKIPQTITHEGVVYELCPEEVEYLLKWKFAIRVNKSAIFYQYEPESKYDISYYGLYKLEYRAHDWMCDLDRGELMIESISKALK